MVVKKPWHESNIQVMKESMAIFKAMMQCRLGDGSLTLFRTSWWLEDERIEELVPHLFVHINKRAIRTHTVKGGLAGRWWLMLALTYRSCPLTNS